MSIITVSKRSVSNYPSISTSSRRANKQPNKKIEKHIKWKEPPVDEVHRYTPPPAIPRVHWREPLVEEMYRYPSLIHLRKPKPDTLSKPLPPPPKGILKDGKMSKFVKSPKPEIINMIDQSLDAAALPKYPPLIPYISKDLVNVKGQRKGILKNPKQEKTPDSAINDDHFEHHIFDDLNFDLFDLSIDDQLFYIFDSGFFSEDTEGEPLDSSAQKAPPIQNLPLQPRANTISTISETLPSPSTPVTAESRGHSYKLTNNALGLEQMILPIAVFALFKNAWQIFDKWSEQYGQERHGKRDISRPRLHSRDWQVTNGL